LILVDSSVWIDYLRNRATAQTDWLDQVVGKRQIAVGDLVLTEVLQGIRQDRDFQDALRMFAAFPVVEIAGKAVAMEAARNYRHLRAMGVTVRKTIDALIATRCIMDDHELLFSDRDFIPFVTELGLADAMK
jgi:predicted nucleic acid-binding protein